MQGEDSKANFSPDGGKLCLLPDFSLELTFYAVESIFVNDTTSFNIVLEFDQETKPKDLS